MFLKTVAGNLAGYAIARAGDGGGYARDGWPFVSMAWLLLCAGALLWAAVVVWTTVAMHRPPRMTPGRALARLGRAFPPDVGFDEYEEVVFNVPARSRPHGSIALAAWWIPHTAGAAAITRMCIMLHGYGDSRAGSLAWAPLWQRLGYHLLPLDLRGHGESGGRCASGGGWEAGDLHAVIDQLRERHPMAARDIVLFGVSYGAMIAAACAAGRDDVAALVLESPVDGWASATRRYADLLGLPLAHAHGLRLNLAASWLGVRFEDVRPANTLPRVICPTLAIVPSSDVLVSPTEADAIAHAVAANPANEVWRPATTHNMALASDAAEYENRLRRFLSSRVTASRAEGVPSASADS